MDPTTFPGSSNGISGSAASPARIHPAHLLGLYIVLVFVGGAILAPWLYWFVSGCVPDLAQKPFHRYVNRSILAMALLGLWPFLRLLGARSLHDLGLVPWTGQWKRLAVGFAVGFASMACLAALALGFGARGWNPQVSALNILEIVSAAAGVAMIEEILFRGALFGALRRVWNWPSALALTSVTYAMVHFLERAHLTGEVRWNSGLVLLPQMLAGLGNMDTLIPGLINLVLVGAILALAFQRTRTLWFSIGLHAGWVFWLKGWNSLSIATTGNTRLWGTGKLYDGWMTLPVLLAVLAIVWFLLPNHAGSHPESERS